MKMVYFFCCAAIVCLGRTVYPQTLLEPLPADEKQADYLLQSGALDSALWRMVEPFYMEPIVVPAGELRLLLDVFPELPRDLPITPKALSRYEPWNEGGIGSFFEDYPAMIMFKPILSFAFTRERSIGSVTAAFHRYKDYDPALAVTFGCTPYPGISAQGRIRTTAGAARWLRRSVSSTVPAPFSLAVGNFSQRPDDGLFFGYFRAGHPSDTDVAGNWRYGASNTWNGVRVGLNLREVTANGYVHERLRERVGGVWGNYGGIRHFDIVGGLAAAVVDPFDTTATDTTLWLHCGVRYRRSGWRAGLFSGVEAGSTGAVPAYVYVGHGAGRASVEVSLTHFPAGASLPISAQKHEAFRRLTIPDSLRVDCNVLKTEVRSPLGERVGSVAGVEFFNASGAYFAETYAEISGGEAAPYRLRYVWMPPLSGITGYHRFNGSVEKDFSGAMRAELTARATRHGSGVVSFTARSSVCTVISPAADVELFVSTYGTGNRIDWSVGCVHRARFYEKNSMMIKIECPFNNGGYNGWVMDVRAMFTL